MVLIPAITFSPEDNPSEILVDTVPASFELNTYWGVFPDGNVGIAVISVSIGEVISIMVNVPKIKIDEIPDVLVTVMVSSV